MYYMYHVSQSCFTGSMLLQAPHGGNLLALQGQLGPDRIMPLVQYNLQLLATSDWPGLGH